MNDMSSVDSEYLEKIQRLYVVYDNSCKLLDFILLRAPRLAHYILPVIDAMHYSGHHNCSPLFNHKLLVTTRKLNAALNEQVCTLKFTYRLQHLNHALCRPLPPWMARNLTLYSCLFVRKIGFLISWSQVWVRWGRYTWLLAVAGHPDSFDWLEICLQKFRFEHLCTAVITLRYWIYAKLSTMVSAVCCVMLAEYVLNSSNTTPSVLAPSCHNIGDVSESVTCKYLHWRTHLHTQIRVHYCAPIHVCSLVYTNSLTDIHMTRDGKLYQSNL